jgi:hypothetical protein
MADNDTSAQARQHHAKPEWQQRAADFWQRVDNEGRIFRQSQAQMQASETQTASQQERRAPRLRQ